MDTAYAAVVNGDDNLTESEAADADADDDIIDADELEFVMSRSQRIRLIIAKMNAISSLRLWLPFKFSRRDRRCGHREKEEAITILSHYHYVM